MRQKNYWSYFTFSQMQLVEGKIVPKLKFNKHRKRNPKPKPETFSKSTLKALL